MFSSRIGVDLLSTLLRRSSELAGHRRRPLGNLFAGNQRLGGGQRRRFVVVGDFVAVAAAGDGGGGGGGIGAGGVGGRRFSRCLDHLDGDILKHTQITGHEQTERNTGCRMAKERASISWLSEA